MFEIFKIILLGIVEGITEWLPISSTGHMILLDEFIKLKANDGFKEMFFVLIQLGAIGAVITLYWEKLFPVGKKTLHKKKSSTNSDLPETKTVYFIDKKKLDLLLKVFVACLPAAIIGVLFDDWFDAKFYNYQTVAIMLIIYGILFIVIENRFSKKEPTIKKLDDITYKEAIFIGLFQILALVPGTSRSGATIIGGMIANVSRAVASEFTFLLAVPVMLGASLLKLLKFGLNFSLFEFIYLVIGMVTAYVVSAFAIKIFISYIKKHDFKIFGYYRIALGVMILIYFIFSKRI